jgi:multidrug efflux pump subunit AcrA (membrane-fusion protein)
VRVSRPATWIALAGLLVVLAAVVLWATLSTITTTASGLGFVLPEGGLIEASAQRPGVLQQVNVTSNERVDAGDVIGELEGADGARFSVTAPIGGRVGEVVRSPGDFVPQGGQVAIIVPVRPRVVEAFLPTSEAKQARLGDEVWVAPTTVPVSDFGYARGRVASIGEIPIPDAGIDSLLENPARVRLVSGLGPVFHVVVELDYADTPSGLSWTASEGPSDPVTLGSRAKVSVVTGERAPIDYVVG